MNKISLKSLYYYELLSEKQNKPETENQTPVQKTLKNHYNFNFEFLVLSFLVFL